MKRFQNRNKVNPPVIKEDSTEQRNISSPEDLQPALQHVAQPNVAAARKTGIGSRIVRGISAAGHNIRRFFKPKMIVKKATEDPSGINDVLSTNDREPAPWTTTEDNHQTPITQPSHGSSNSDIEGKSCAAMPTCSVVTNTCVKDQSCPVVSNKYIMKDQFRPIFNTIAVNKSAFWIPYKTYTTTDHNPSTPVLANSAKSAALIPCTTDTTTNHRPSPPVPPNNVKKDWPVPVFSKHGPTWSRSRRFLNTVALKNKSAALIPYTTDTTTNHRPSPPVPPNNVKKDWPVPVFSKYGPTWTRSPKVLNTVALKDKSAALIPYTTTNHRPSPSVLSNSAKKDWPCPVFSKDGPTWTRSPKVLNTVALKDKSAALIPYTMRTELPFKTYIIKKHNSSIPVPVNKGRSPTVVTNTGAMKDQSCTVVPNNSAMKSSADRSSSILQNAIVMKYQSPALLPNAVDISDRSAALLSIAGAMEDQSCSVVPIPPGIMKEQSPTVPPKTNVIWDKSYSLAMEKGFTFHKILGQGSFGKVMLASHPSTSMILAVKIIEKKIKVYPEERLLKEVRNNLFITHLYDSFQSESQLFLVMEYLSGGALLQLIKHSAPLPEDTLRNLTADILCGLEFLHSKNIVHRDLKPDNILLDDDGRAKIADLGLSISGVSEKKKIRGLTGSLPYMAPEVLEGIPYYTMADYFSLGVIVYQMAVGKHPFWKGQKTALEMLRTVRSKKVYIPPRLNRQLRDLIDRLLRIQQEIRKLQVRGLRSHRFFLNFDWAKIQKRPPLPKIDLDL